MLFPTKDFVSSVRHLISLLRCEEEADDEHPTGCNRGNIRGGYGDRQSRSSPIGGRSEDRWPQRERARVDADARAGSGPASPAEKRRLLSPDPPPTSRRRPTCISRSGSALRAPPATDSP